jgi:predicted nucleic acid-binding protein
MTDRRTAERLERISRLAERALKHLLTTDRRLFDVPFTVERAESLASDEALAERVEAFVSRFGRLQDMLGDKLLPAYLAAHGEKVATVVENLDRAERLGLIQDAQAWMDMRRLRNLMVHEYVDDPTVLASALEAGHVFVPIMEESALRMLPTQRTQS